MVLKAKPQEPDHSKLTQLSNIKPSFVSVVPKGANRQDSWLVVKNDDTEKAVPAADADDETKRDALEGRAKSYGIEIRDDASLTYPKGDPTTEKLYGDPVNLAYPLGDDGNAADVGRIKNALSRFKQAHSTYNKGAALAAGVDVSYDPEDAIDSLLPADLKTRLAKDEPTNTDDNGTDGEQTRAKGADLKARIAKARTAARIAAAKSATSAAVEPVVPAVPAAEERIEKGAGDEVSTRKLDEALARIEKLDAEVTSLRVENERLAKAYKKERQKAANLNTRIGSTVHVTPADHETVDSDSRKEKLFAGEVGDGDLAPPLPEDPLQ